MIRPEIANTKVGKEKNLLEYQSFLDILDQFMDSLDLEDETYIETLDKKQTIKNYIRLFDNYLSDQYGIYNVVLKLDSIQWLSEINQEVK